MLTMMRTTTIHTKDTENNIQIESNKVKVFLRSFVSSWKADVKFSKVIGRVKTKNQKVVIKKEVCEGRYDGNVKLRVVTIVIEDVVLSWIATT